MVLKLLLRGDDHIEELKKNLSLADLAREMQSNELDAKQKHNKDLMLIVKEKNDEIKRLKTSKESKPNALYDSKLD